EFLHHPGTPQRRRVAPLRERGRGGRYGGVDEVLVRKNHSLRHLPRRGIEHLAIARCRGDGLAANPRGHGFQLQFSRLVHPVARFPPLSLAIAAFTRGMTCSAISCIERFSSLGSTQSMPA